MMVKAEEIEGGGSGEALERSRRSRKVWLIGVLVAAGFVGGFLSGYTQADALFDSTRTWPPALGVGLAILYLVAVVGGGVLLSRYTDEFERMAQYRATTAGAVAYIVVYPVWLLLWKSGLVPEPMHFIIYLLFMAVVLIASLFYRVR